MADIPGGLTPDQLMQAIHTVEDSLSKTIFCHPLNVDRVQEWKDGYEFGKFITIIPSSYVPHNKLIMVPSHTIERPSWMA